MTERPVELENTFRVADRVAEILEAAGLNPILIGALAMAVHNYPRQTEDLDLAVALDPRRLQALEEELAKTGWAVELSPPDPQDPLGGVVTIRAPDALPVQVVNFDNSPSGGFPALVRDAARSSLAGLRFKVVSVIDLILFKLYAGGPKSEQDILELLVRNPVDLDELRRRCEQYRLTPQLERTLQRVGR